MCLAKKLSGLAVAVVLVSAVVLALTVVSHVALPISGIWAAEPLDINLATGPELQALPGIGPKNAQKIIMGRPYKRKDELVQKGIIPKATFDRIKDQIIVKQK
jgi:competence protein ComEA